MKLILLLLAIYSLIFYQHYKIEKSRMSLPESEPKVGKSYPDHSLLNEQGYGSANYLIRRHNSITPERQVARFGL